MSARCGSLGTFYFTILQVLRNECFTGSEVLDASRSREPAGDFVDGRFPAHGIDAGFLFETLLASFLFPWQGLGFEQFERPPYLLAVLIVSLILQYSGRDHGVNERRGHRIRL